MWADAFWRRTTRTRWLSWRRRGRLRPSRRHRSGRRGRASPHSPTMCWSLFQGRGADDGSELAHRVDGGDVEPHYRLHDPIARLLQLLRDAPCKPPRVNGPGEVCWDDARLGRAAEVERECENRRIVTRYSASLEGGASYLRE